MGFLLGFRGLGSEACLRIGIPLADRRHLGTLLFHIALTSSSVAARVRERACVFLLSERVAPAGGRRSPPRKTPCFLTLGSIKGTSVGPEIWRIQRTFGHVRDCLDASILVAPSFCSGNTDPFVAQLIPSFSRLPISGHLCHSAGHPLSRTRRSLSPRSSERSPSVRFHASSCLLAP